MGFHIANEPEADRVLDEYPFAVLAGMALDQQYGMEHAFRGGWKLLTRMGDLDTARIAAMDPEEFKAVCAETPAVHRFPASMATKLQGIAVIVEQEYGGDVTRLWTEASTGKELLKRIMALPGFGKQKAQIFVALLAKQLGVKPDGWEAAAGDYALEGYRSVADVVDEDSLLKVREYKQAAKAAAKADKA
ncbi:HhH-GPD-type base excision DNA repair protein [Nocardioides sp. Bht2]|uniref:HhH-GPD-type base excision DNA repair protein n=1 Tax=Nocardioides sp. Bht2 TaxID=3392297 RepID=UPI0039B4E825